MSLFLNVLQETLKMEIGRERTRNAYGQGYNVDGSWKDIGNHYEETSFASTIIEHLGKSHALVLGCIFFHSISNGSCGSPPQQL